MKQRSEKNLDSQERRNAEAEAGSVTPADPFEEGEQTLIRPDRHHHEDLEGSGDGFERDLTRPQSVPRPMQERNFYSKGLPDWRLRTVVGERSNPLWPSKVRTR